MRFATIIATALTVLALSAGAPEAARDQAPATSPVRLELLVLEVKNCHVCQLVRDHIKPAWDRSARARDVPMRTVDITHIDETKLGLTSPVETMPTILLMRDGQEVGRLTGYMGLEIFFRAIGHLIDQVE